MPKEGIIRCIILAVILVAFAYLSVGYTYEIARDKGAFDEMKVDVDDIDSVNIDGSDFTPIFQIMGAGVNGMMDLASFLVDCIYAMVILVVSLIASVLLRCIGLRKKKHCVCEKEKIITKWMYFGVIGASILLGLILARFTTIIQLLICTAVWVAPSLLIYVLPLLMFKNQAAQDEAM